MLSFSASLGQHIPVFPSIQSTVSMEGDKLVHVQKWDGKETKFVRELKDGKMVMVRFLDRVRHLGIAPCDPGDV